MNYKDYLKSNNIDFIILHDNYTLNNVNKYSLRLSKNSFDDEYKYEVPNAFKINGLSIKKEHYDDFINNKITLQVENYYINFPIKLMTLMSKLVEVNDEIIINFNWDFFFSNCIILQSILYNDLIISVENSINYDVKLCIEKLYKRYQNEYKDYILYINQVYYEPNTNKLEINKRTNGVFVNKNPNSFQINFTSNVAMDHKNMFFKTKIESYKLENITKSLYDIKYIDYDSIVSGNLNYELLDIKSYSEKKYNTGEIMFEQNNDYYVIKHNAIKFYNGLAGLRYV